MSLFESGAPQQPTELLPLASRMRPTTLDEYVGQEHLLGPDSPTTQAIKAGKLGSVVLWAPPGCGKTTLANIIAHYSKSQLVALSAVTAGVADIRKAAAEAKSRYQFHKIPTLLLVDEIHHFNKSQQDSLLGFLEDGTFQFIGATTENPFFALNNALLSRARVLPLQPLTPGSLTELLQRALIDEDRGVGKQKCSISTEAETFLLTMANGDARLLLNALETAVLMSPAGSEIQVGLLEQILQKNQIRYDKKGDNHYDTISAFIKSIRGSNSDAALHYLARMIKAGEDPRFIARRLVILASEDIGNAEPQALILASSTLRAVEVVGMPESRIILSQCVTFLSEAPKKSNRAYLAINKAQADVEAGLVEPIPMHLRNAPHSGMKELGHGEGYQYPHDDPSGWVDVDYLPEAELSVPYYEPSSHGYEAKIVERRKSRQSKSKS